MYVNYTGLRVMVLAVFLLPGCFAPVWAANHCVILQYHHFSAKTPAITSVTPEQFDAHLEYLQANDFHVLPLRDVVSALQRNKSLPERCVSLTVDDAYISVYENAFPRLRKRAWPLTVFVNTQGVDQGIRSYMSWGQMREMADHGVSFENHGHGHIHMIRRINGESDADWRKRIIRDIRTAQQRLSTEIGVDPRLFAYPYGEYNPELVDIIRDMGFVGFGQQSGPAWSGADLGVLPRFPMAAAYARMPGFITKVNTLPFAVIAAAPADPLVPLREKRPALKLSLAPGTYRKSAIQCYIDGSHDVSITWSGDQFTVRPNFELGAGRHRTNCTMPSAQRGRFHWYSHNWFIRKPDGSWYPEY